jgi:hypothetical protein
VPVLLRPETITSSIIQRKHTSEQRLGRGSVLVLLLLFSCSPSEPLAVSTHNNSAYHVFSSIFVSCTPSPAAVQTQTQCTH